MKIGFIGMSHLGICHAVAAAEKGFIVKCFDESLYKIEQLSKGFIDFFEPNIFFLINCLDRPSTLRISSNKPILND